MFFSFSLKNLFFDNNSSHFSKQECVTVALLAFFILCLPLFSLLPHTRATLALVILILFLRALASPKGIDFWRRDRIFFFLYLATILAGVCKRGAAIPSLFAFFVALAGFLPPLTGISREAFCRAVSFSGIAVGAFALLQHFTGEGLSIWTDTEQFGVLARVGSFFGNPNLLGAFSCVSLILSLDMARKRLRRGGFAVYLLSFLLSFASLLVSYSRGAWGGALIGIFFYFFCLFEKKRGGTTKTYALAPFGTLLSRALSVFSGDSSISYRFSLWRSILSVPFSKLLFGVGEGKTALLSLLSPYMAAGLEKIEHTHSLFFHVLSAEGLLGLFFFSAFLFTRFRGRSRDFAALDGALLSLTVYGIFDDTLYSGQIGVLFWMLANIN